MTDLRKTLKKNNLPLVAVIRSSKIRLMTHLSREAEVLKYLQQREVFHITSANETREENYTASHKWANLETAIRILAKYENVKKPFSHMLIADKVESSPEHVEKLAQEFDWESVVEKIQTLETKLHESKAEKIKLEEKKIFLEEWKTIHHKLSFESDRFEVLFARFPAISEKSLDDTMHLLPEMSHFSILQKTKLAVLGFFVYEKECLHKVRQYINDLEGNEIRFDFDLSSCSWQEEFNSLCSAQKNIETEIQDILLKLEEMTSHGDNLKLLSDYYSWERDREDIHSKSDQTVSVAIVEGWIPSPEYDRFREDLYARFPETHVEKIEETDEDSEPLDLKNKGLMKPFEIVTRIFGLPASKELDPTPYLAPFFVIFFAFCLTDAGYGIILTALTLGALKIFKMEDGTKQMVKLLCMGGIMTIILGAMFGGWFGIPMQMLPLFIQKLQIFDPINDLQTKIAPIAFGLGFLQLWFGVVLKGITLVKNGNSSEAWQTSFPLALALVASVIWGVSAVMGADAIGLLAKNAFLGLMIFLIWGFGYGTKNIIARPLLGLLGLVNEGVSWLSNVPSYSRLFALGLATGIVAQVFNSLAFTIGALIPVPVVNVLFIIGIIIFGHVLNIALNLLGAFIHSGRLQFIEFFGKFVEGGGQQFLPLRRESKYLFISPQKK